MNQRQFLLSANGVSIICSSDTLPGWTEFVLEKGGVPIIKEIPQALKG